VTEFNDLLKMLQVSDEQKAETVSARQNVVVSEAVNVSSEVLSSIPVDYSPFNIDVFNQELFEKSEQKNQLYREAVQILMHMIFRLVVFVRFFIN